MFERGNIKPVDHVEQEDYSEHKRLVEFLNNKILQRLGFSAFGVLAS